MLEIVTGIALATAAGLNAYVPLLGLGLLSRFTEAVQLPEPWLWLENEWCLGILALLLIVEMLVDKVPALDSVNDVLHTVVRPTSGGMVFSAGTGSETFAVTDPGAFVTSEQVWPFIVGIIVALIPHALKAIARPVINVLTAGAGAAATSVAEDAAAVTLTLLAVFVPLVAICGVIVTCVLLVRRIRRAFRERRLRANAVPRST